MVESFVVDASVVAKWFSTGEANDAEARALKDSYVGGRVDLCAPDLLFFEVANSIWKNPRIKTKTAVSLVGTLVGLAPRLLNPDVWVAEEAMVLARKSKLTFYDTVYLALARSLSSVLITSDREQLSAAEGYTKALSLSAISQFKV